MTQRDESIPSAESQRGRSRRNNPASPNGKPASRQRIVTVTIIFTTPMTASGLLHWEDCVKGLPPMASTITAAKYIKGKPSGGNATASAPQNGLGLTCEC